MRKDVTPLHSLVDRRVVERNIRKGIIGREEYQSFLDGLKDVSANVELVRAKLGVEEETLEDDLPEEDDESEG